MIDRAPVLTATLLLSIHVAIVVVGSRPSVPDERDQLLERMRLLDAALLHGKKTRCFAPPPSTNRGTSHTIEHAVAQTGNDVEGCLLEWNERNIDMTITLTVTPDGHGHSAIAHGGPDSPSLRLCVAESIERMRYPRSPHVLDIEVVVKWSNKRLVQSPRIIGRRQTPRNILDL